MIRILLIIAISGYRLLPWRPSCPRSGLSCSQLGLAAARAGEGVSGVLSVIHGCGGYPCLAAIDGGAPPLLESCCDPWVAVRRIWWR